MSPPGRPKGEYRNAQHEGGSVRLRSAAVLFGLCLWVITPLSAPAQLTRAPDPQAMARLVLGDDPGTAAVAVWRDGQLLQATVRRDAADAAGPAQVVAAGPAPPLFEIGSISKVFTGLLLAQAV